MVQLSPAQPAPGAGSKPIKSWKDPPPWLFPIAATKSFLLLFPLPGMFFPDSSTTKPCISSRIGPLATSFTHKHCLFLHRPPFLRLPHHIFLFPYWAPRDPKPLPGALYCLSSLSLCTCCSPGPGMSFLFPARSFRPLDRDIISQEVSLSGCVRIGPLRILHLNSGAKRSYPGHPNPSVLPWGPLGIY